MCDVSIVGFHSFEQCESSRRMELSEGLKTSEICFEGENRPPDSGIQLFKGKSWDEHPDPVVRDCLRRLGTANECKG